jgi:glycosyltransferase involved in cell wall biosynthesis
MSGEARPVVLVLLGCFWPGNDASGPNQSFIALATALSRAFDFRVVARDRAPGAPVSTAPAGWVDLGYAKARYLPVGGFGAVGLAKLLRETPHDALWLNSVYDREFTLPALAVRFLGAARRPVLLSPRGEFAAGALEVKPGKKQVFLSLVRALGLWRGVTVHATSDTEAKEIAARAPRGTEIVMAPNLRLMLTPPPFVPPGEALRVIFVGRIVPIKGLDFALKVLAQVRTKVEFEIFGPPEDMATASRCEKLAAALPPNVVAHWRGAASNEAIVAALARTDLFFLPTGGENFGHAIFESLSCGAPVLISDRTPWRNLKDAGAGWDLPLDDQAPFVEAVETFAALAPEERLRRRAAAREVAREWVEESGAAEASAKMLRRLTASGAAS